MGAEFENSYFCGRLWKTKKTGQDNFAEKRAESGSRDANIYSESEPPIC
jgi:hypothetical protein